MTTPEEMKRYVRDVPDYPQKGIIFRDITPLLGEKKIFAEVVEMMSRPWAADPPDLVAAIEARGFIPGSAIAVKLGAGFVPIRKTGKLPWTTVMESYDLEYGTDSLEVHSDAVQPGQSVEVHVDALDRSFEGRVEAITPASAATFSLLPQQNVAGNFTKVTQLVPVKISVDTGGVLLPVGTSVEVRIRVLADGGGLPWQR